MDWIKLSEADKHGSESVGLTFETNGLKVGFCINDYKKRDEAAKAWCKVDLGVSMENYVDYSIESKEILLSYEVERLRDELIQIIDADKDMFSIVDFTEPDMLFEFSSVGKEDDIKFYIAKWNVRLPYNGVTEHAISISLTQKELEMLKDYLSLITGMVSIDSMEIHRWIQNGNIIV